MRWIDKLERRFGRLGIPNLMNIICAAQAVVWFLVMFVNANLYYILSLTRTGLMRGYIWEVVTFLFVPTLTYSAFSLLLQLYFYWWVGNSLERVWGSFRFTLYILIGVLGAVVSCLLTGSAGSSGIFLSLFFAYAWMWPEQQILLFFFIPIRVKWLGLAAAVVWLFNFFSLGVTMAYRASLVFGLAGFLVFFGPELFAWCRDTITSYKRRRDWENRWKR